MNVNLPPDIEKRVEGELAKASTGTQISSSRQPCCTSSTNASVVSNDWRRFAGSAEQLTMRASTKAC